MTFPGIKEGMTITIRRTIGEDDTVGNHLPDDIEKLLSSPGLVSLMIEASVRMIHPQLPDGFVSVGQEFGGGARPSHRRGVHSAHHRHGRCLRWVPHHDRHGGGPTSWVYAGAVRTCVPS